MATESTTPTSTPAASPAPVASPAPAATPAVTSTPAATPAVQQQEDTRSTREVIRDQFKDSFNPDGSYKDEPTEGDAAAGDTPDENADPVIQDDAQPDADATPADQTPAADEDDDAVDFSGGAIDLTAALDADPATKAALEANPDLKGKLFAMARRSALVDKFQEAGIASPEEAAVVVAGNNAFASVSDRIAAVDPAQLAQGDFSSIDQALRSMVEQTIIRDAEGNPVLGKDGQPQNDGSVGRLMRGFFMDRMAGFAKDAETAGDEEYAAAVDTIMERNGMRGSSTPNEDGLTPEQVERNRKLEEREKSINARDTEQRQREEATYYESVNTANTETLDKAVTKVLDGASGLTPFARGKAEQDIRKALQVKLAGTPLKQELSALNRMPFGQERQAKHMAIAKRYVASYLGAVAKTVLEAAGADVITKQQQRAQTDTARRTAAQSETRSSLAAGHTAAATGEVTMDQVEKELTEKSGGQRPSTKELVAEYARRQK